MEKQNYEANKLCYLRILTLLSLCEFLFCTWLLNDQTDCRYGEGENSESAVSVLIDAVMAILLSIWPNPRINPKNQKSRWIMLRFVSLPVQSNSRSHLIK